MISVKQYGLQGYIGARLAAIPADAVEIMNLKEREVRAATAALFTRQFVGERLDIVRDNLNMMRANPESILVGSPASLERALDHILALLDFEKAVPESSGENPTT